MKTSKYHNPIRINLLIWIIVTITLGFSLQSNAQSENKNKLLQMIGEDPTTIDSIAGYDQKVRSNIFQVAKTPEVLNKTEELQKRSQNQFRAIINDYDRDAQAAFYEMARYPSLITDLVRNGKPSSSEVTQIVSNYPEDIHATANNYALRYYDVLLRIDQLNNEIDRAFQLFLEPYDEETRKSVNAILSYPEIVSTLVEDKDFTALLGVVYSEDPEWLENRLGQISKELAEQNKEDLDTYKNQIQNDPEAYNEMLEASDEYAKENNEVRSRDNSSDPIVDVRVVNSYPYWFGYPYWYTDPYWRPLPLYYQTGFYRNNFGAVVFIGLPSFHFLHWHTYYHPTLYPHLSYNYYSYYENHYANRYRDSRRPIPHNGFYRSIEANVINNPRVNNSNLERIDRQRGNNIVRRPNIVESGSTQRAYSGITRQREIPNSQRAYGTRGIERNNVDNQAGTTNRRQYNTINPGRSEGSYNNNGLIRSGTTPVESSKGRPGQGTSAGNNNRYERPRFNGANISRSGYNTSPSAPALKAGRSVQPQSKATKASGRREVRVNRSSARAASSGNSKKERRNGRR